MTAVGVPEESPREFTQVSGLPDRVPRSEAKQLWKMWIRDAYEGTLSPEDFKKINDKIDEVVDNVLKGTDGRVDRTALLKNLGKMNTALERRINPDKTSDYVIGKLGTGRFK